jgi:hypothetical protein
MTAPRARAGVLLAALFLALDSPALDVHLQADRLTVKADGERLTDVLRRLVHAGVRVRVDPRAEARVTADFRDEDVQQALDVLLKHFGYVLIWDVVEGPVGRIPRLSEVQVFLPGRKKNLQPLDAGTANFAVTSGPLAGGPPFVKDEVLLGFRAGTQRGEVERLLAQIGGAVINSVPELGVYLVRLPPESNVPALVDQLRSNPLVAEAEPNYVVSVAEPTPSEAPVKSSLVPRIAPASGAPALAILDSGLAVTPEIEQAVAGRYDAVDPTRALADPVGHGTQMAMIASGAVTPALGGAGAGDAASVPLLAIRAFDDRGYASNFSLMRSMAYALERGARVVNMSWGSDTSSGFLEAAVDYARSKGLIVVASAGNEGQRKAKYPAAYPGVLAVSASGPDNTLWEGSNYGDYVFAAAPGLASFPVGYRGPPGAYAGTSISSAYVARALALYLAKHPGASADQAALALREALTDAGPAGRDPQFGHGLLDAAALARLLE